MQTKTLLYFLYFCFIYRKKDNFRLLKAVMLTMAGLIHFIKFQAPQKMTAELYTLPKLSSWCYNGIKHHTPEKHWQSQVFM